MAFPKLAVGAVISLIAFLSYSSQLLFLRLEPGPLDHYEAWTFNAQLLALLLSYAQSCLRDPGKVAVTYQSDRTCRKCEGPKPERTHHCSVCQRCVLKMDHHCPWTANCVGHRTLPCFIRFLFYCVSAMSQLQIFLFKRVSFIWDKRHLPSYYGPSTFQLIHLFALVLVNSLTLFALFVIFVQMIWAISNNTSSIEQRQIEKHEGNVLKAAKRGGYLLGPGGIPIRVERVEFPYDIGIWKNLSQAMGTGNPVAWFWPLSSIPTHLSGLRFEKNDFGEHPWPPLDPEKMSMKSELSDPFAYSSQDYQPDEIEDFYSRQRRDQQRWTSQTSKTDAELDEYLSEGEDMSLAEVVRHRKRQ